MHDHSTLDTGLLTLEVEFIDDDVCTRVLIPIYERNKMKHISIKLT
jgi:hypothetical protein